MKRMEHPFDGFQGRGECDICNSQNSPDLRKNMAIPNGHSRK